MSFRPRDGVAGSSLRQKYNAGADLETQAEACYSESTMRTEDGYIIQECLDGDSAAFGLLVEKYKKGIYALAYSRVSNFHDAQDITQEVFTRPVKDCAP